MNKVKPILLIYSRENGNVTQRAFKLSTFVFFIVAFFSLLVLFSISTYGFVTYSLRTYNLNYELAEAKQELTALKIERERFKSYLTFIEQTDPLTLAYLYDANDILSPEAESLLQEEIDSNHPPLENAPTSELVKAKPEIVQDDGIIKLENARVTLHSDENIINLYFNLRNTKIIPKITGDALFTLIKADTNEEIPFTKLKATSFVFSNLKEIHARLTPQDKRVTKDDLIQIKLIVDGKQVYSEIIPIK